MSRPAVIAAMLLVAALPGRARAEGEPIVDIEVVENTKTEDRTVALIADLEVGDPYTDDLGWAIRERLITSGLFKEVDVFTTPVPGGVKVTIVAREKHSWVVGPTFYTQPGNIGGGLGFAESNLFGQNRKLLLYGQIATADSMFLAGYLDPSIGNSPFYWRFDTYLRHAKITEFGPWASFWEEPQPERRSTMNYLNAGAMIGVNLWRGMAFDARMRGAYVFFRDVSWEDPGAHPGVEPEVPQEDGWDVSYELKLTRDRRANWHGVTTGTVLRLSWEQALPPLGSDVAYFYTSAGMNWGIKYWKEHNLLLKLGGTLGRTLPFQQEQTVGGAPGLRGFQSWQFRGNTRVGATVEYSVPLFKIGPFAFRALGFSDSAFITYTGDGDNERRNYLPLPADAPEEPWQLRVGVGAGFRVYVKSVVLPLLGVDVAHGLGADDPYRIYFALGLVEL